ncbi:MAG: ETC complex I subunit [Acetobacteraceae bacterium]|nr:ETC complex I subunit [Acetobacteraceae bacterium]
MTTARIYQHPKSAMQSGQATTHEWVLEFPDAEARKPDALMGWIGSGDTQAQVRLKFATRDDAVAYATRKGVAFAVELPKARTFKPKAYADNFAFTRSENWTH